MLDYNIVHIATGGALSHIALQIMIVHSQLEVQGALNIHRARLGRSLGVHLSVKKFGGANTCQHVSAAALNGHIVTGSQFIGRGLGNFQEGFLHIGQGGTTVMGQSTDHVASVIVVIRVAPKNDKEIVKRKAKDGMI